MAQYYHYNITKWMVDGGWLFVVLDTVTVECLRCYAFILLRKTTKLSALFHSIQQKVPGNIMHLASATCFGLIVHHMIFKANYFISINLFRC